MLQRLRENKNISQSQLSKMSGVSVRMIQQYEQGVRNINGAKLETLLDLAAVLDCKISDIITDNDLKLKIKKHSIR